MTNISTLDRRLISTSIFAFVAVLSAVMTVLWVAGKHQPALAQGDIENCKDGIVERQYDYSDKCLYSARVGQIFTLDVRIIEEHKGQEDIVIEIPYSNLRYSGAILQVYYNLAVGKAQWLPFPSTRGIYIMPDSLLLPIGSWIESGLTIGTFVRIVLLTTSE